jgi:hypothetical protein
MALEAKQEDNIGDLVLNPTICKESINIYGGAASFFDKTKNEEEM